MIKDTTQKILIVCELHQPCPNPARGTEPDGAKYKRKSRLPSRSLARTLRIEVVRLLVLSYRVFDGLHIVRTLDMTHSRHVAAGTMLRQNVALSLLIFLDNCAIFFGSRF